MRSPMTSATEVRSGKMLALDGSAPSASTVKDAPSGGRSCDGHLVCSCARTGPAIRMAMAMVAHLKVGITTVRTADLKVCTTTERKAGVVPVSSDAAGDTGVLRPFRPAVAESGVVRAFRPAVADTGVVRAFRPADAYSGVVRAFRPAAAPQPG